MVLDQLNLFRQLAVANNYIVEVRFYKYIDPGIPGDTGHYRAMQAFKVVQLPGTISYTKTPITRPVRIPPSIIIDSGSGGTVTSTVSRLTKVLVLGTGITNQGTQSSGVQTPSSASGDPTIFNVGMTYTYAAFQINPDGSTNLPVTAANGPWIYFMTLHQLSSGDGLITTSLPKNYYTIQIDPANGHLYTYRP